MGLFRACVGDDCENRVLSDSENGAWQAAAIFFVLTLLFLIPTIIFIILAMVGERFYRFVNWAKVCMLLANLWMILGVIL